MFILYYKLNCPYSENAKQLIEQLKLNYKLIIIDSYNHPIKQQLIKEYNHNTLPAIFFYDNINNDINNKLIDSNGLFMHGYNDFNNIINIINKLTKNNINDIYEEVKSNLSDCSYKTFLKLAICIKAK